MDSNSTQRPQSDAETKTSSAVSGKKFSWPLFFKQMLAACLLGCLLGSIASNPINYAVNKTENYLNARRERAAYGRVLPQELHTIIASYRMLRNDFYRDIPALDYLNGALVGINIACELDDKNKKNGSKIQGKQTAASGPAPSPSASASPAAGAPVPSPSASRRSAAQTYQEYAKITAEALRAPRAKTVYPLLKDKKQSEEELLQQFTQTVLKAIDDGKIDKEKICYGALCGMTTATADPYSTVLDKDETRELNEDLGNEDFCGIGVYIEADMRNGKQLTVIEPIDGSPAAEAGMQAGDCITKIDGRPTKEMSLELAAKSIRGPEGSIVRLTIARPQAKEFTLNIKRQKVAKKSATSKMLSDRIGYIRLRFFGHDTGSDCRQALQSLIDKKADAIVLDLRNNPGGAVEESVITASLFLEKGQLVTSVETPRTERHEMYNAIGGQISRLPLAVLINGYSASASEIVAGALKDHKRGILVGETTFGKGSVQLFRQVGCEMALKYTIAHYLTPNLRDINLKGIEPDVVCEAPYSNRLGGSDDKQLQEALRQLAQLKPIKQEQQIKSEHPRQQPHIDGHS